MLPVDPAQAEYVGRRLLGVAPAEVPVLCAALEPHRSRLTPTLWTELAKARPGDPSLLTSAAALALFDPDGPRWSELDCKVSEALIHVNPMFLGQWLDALRPVRGRLAAPLERIFVKGGSEIEHELATIILVDYATDDPDRLASLLMAADPKAYLAFFRIAERHSEKVCSHFKSELERRATVDWSDRPLDPSWTRLTPRCRAVRIGPGATRRPVRVLPGDAAGQIHLDCRGPAAIGLSPCEVPPVCRRQDGLGGGGLDPRRAEMADRIGRGGW